MDVNPDYKDLLRVLNSYHVKYLVIGAHALAFYTEPRYTKDLDVWVEPSPENAEKVLAALREFGAPVRNLTQEDLVNPKTVFQIGIAPNRIDILTSISGVRFPSAWQNKTKTKYGGVSIHIISVDDFVRNKEATGRLQDRADAAAVQAMLKTAAARDKPRTARKRQT
jgi:predicted nucleotidyltransferase